MMKAKTIYLDDELVESIEKLSKKEDRNPHQIIIRALKDYFYRVERE